MCCIPSDKINLYQATFAFDECKFWRASSHHFSWDLNLRLKLTKLSADQCQILMMSVCEHNAVFLLYIVLCRMTNSTVLFWKSSRMMHYVRLRRNGQSCHVYVCLSVCVCLSLCPRVHSILSRCFSSSRSVMCVLYTFSCSIPTRCNQLDSILANLEAIVEVEMG